MWQLLSKFNSTFTFFSKSSSAVIDCLLTDRQKKFIDIGAVFRSNFGKNQVLRFSLMHSFPRKNPVVTWTSVFKTMQNFYAKSQKFSRSNSETKKKLFLKTCHLFRKIFWRQKLHFWQPSHKNARQKRKKIRHSKSENISKKVFTDPTFISAKSMHFRKSCQKEPIVSYSSALGMKLFKNFGFLYLKILSSFKGRLVT